VIFILSLTENLSNCPRDVEVETPFADVKLEYATAISYLDTIGRPKIVMKAKRLTDKHAGVVYVSLSGISYCTSNPLQVSYKVSLIAHLRKPVAVTIGTFGLFALSWLIGWDSQFLQKKNGKN
jgi:oligosaccharyltransferase complex subunit alpha (ribophorin I)